MTKTAVLFVHGIIGRKEQFDFLIPHVPSDWTYRNITLDGHGGTPLDFAHTSMKKWKAQVHEEAIALRNTHDKFYIVGHSMGTLFAMSESLEITVDGLFLLNVPLKVHIPKQLLKLTWSVYRDKIDPDDKLIVAGKNAYGIGPDKNIFHYVGWVPRYLELFREIARVNKLVSKITTPSHAYISKLDEMASPKTAGILREKSSIPVTELLSSSHFYYAPEDMELIVADFKKEIIYRM